MFDEKKSKDKYAFNVKYKDGSAQTIRRETMEDIKAKKEEIHNNKEWASMTDIYTIIYNKNDDDYILINDLIEFINHHQTLEYTEFGYDDEHPIIYVEELIKLIEGKQEKRKDN